LPEGGEEGKRVRGRFTTLGLRWLLGLATVSALHLSIHCPAGAQSRSEFVPTFSTSPRVQQQVQKLGQLAAAKDWEAWLTTYQQLVDDPKDLVIPRDEEFFVGVRYHCHQALAALPLAVRQRYRALHDGEARRMYDMGAAENNPSLMRELYTRLRFSSFANRALVWLARRDLDEGRVEMARVGFARAAREPDADAGLLLHYGLAAGAAGKPAEARSAWERMRREFGGQRLQVAGRATTAGAAADALLKELPPERARGDGWPSFAGDGGDRKMAGVVSGKVVKLWDVPQGSTGPAVNPRSSRFLVNGGPSSYRYRFSQLLFPVVRDDRVWLQGARSFSAVGLRDGSREGPGRWERLDTQLARDEQLPEPPPEGRFGSSYRSGSRSVQAAPALEGDRVVTRLPLSAAERDSGRWPADVALSAYDIRTGAPLWRRVAGGDPRGVFFNMPTLASNVVVSGVATFKGGITESAAVALDGGTGETLWTTYLGAGSDPLAYVDGSPPAVRDGLVWIESALYTLNALDLLTGELRFVYRYRPTRNLGYRSGSDGAPLVTNEPISLIATAPSMVVFAPRWGTDLVAIDPTAGKLLWSTPKAARGSTVGALFAIDGKRAYLCGDQLQAVNLADGAREWNWEPDTPMGTLGFAALAGDRIYVPLDGKIQVRSAADGEPIEVLDTQAALGESTGYATVTVANEVLIISTQDRVVAVAAATK
jgi:outer membrane protein assembly factor BamB